MKTPSDGALDRLRDVTQWPDLTGTRYELVGEVARGGMGVVYRARDRELEPELRYAGAAALREPAPDADPGAARVRRDARGAAARRAGVTAKEAAAER